MRRVRVAPEEELSQRGVLLPEGFGLPHAAPALLVRPVVHQHHRLQDNTDYKPDTMAPISSWCDALPEHQMARITSTTAHDTHACMRAASMHVRRAHRHLPFRQVAVVADASLPALEYHPLPGPDEPARLI